MILHAGCRIILGSEALLLKFKFKRNIIFKTPGLSRCLMVLDAADRYCMLYSRGRRLAATAEAPSIHLGSNRIAARSYYYIRDPSQEKNFFISCVSCWGCRCLCVMQRFASPQLDLACSSLASLHVPPQPSSPGCYILHAHNFAILSKRERFVNFWEAFHEADASFYDEIFSYFIFINFIFKNKL